MSNYSLNSGTERDVTETNCIITITDVALEMLKIKTTKYVAAGIDILFILCQSFKGHKIYRNFSTLKFWPSQNLRFKHARCYNCLFDYKLTTTQADTH